MSYGVDGVTVTPAVPASSSAQRVAPSISTGKSSPPPGVPP